MYIPIKQWSGCKKRCKHRMFISYPLNNHKQKQKFGFLSMHFWHKVPKLTAKTTAMTVKTGWLMNFKAVIGMTVLTVTKSIKPFFNIQTTIRKESKLYGKTLQKVARLERSG